MRSRDGGRPATGTAPKRILWVSYLRPEGFSLSPYRSPETSIEEVASNAAAVAWAEANRGARISGMVVVVAYMPGLDYDPAQILHSVKASCRAIPFVVSVRENGPLFRPSHYAFTAEFREICGYGSIVVEADSSASRVDRRSPKDDADGKRDRGVSLEPRWDRIAGQAVALAHGRGRLSPPASSHLTDEATRLVTAMRTRGSRDAFGLIHKRVMIALGQPGASMHSADLASVLGYSVKSITNSYSGVAMVMRGSADDWPDHNGHRGQWASDFCKQLGRDYQDWLISFGIRSRLLPLPARR